LIPLLFLVIAMPIAGDRALDQAIADRDTSAVMIRIQVIAQEQGPRSISILASTVARVEEIAEEQWHYFDRHRIFVTAIRAVPFVPASVVAKEFDTLIRTSKKWPARLFLLEASLQSASIDSIQLALATIDDKAPQVVAVAARILGRSQEILALDPLVLAMSRWEDSKTAEKTLRGGREELSHLPQDRTWLACRDALHRLTGLSLHGAEQYKNWIATHRGEIDPSRAGDIKTSQPVTGTGLFGLDITGKNIVFIVDTSGSMLATDPPSKEAIEKARRSTGVDETVEQKLEELMEHRRRILRARREVSRAIEGLGDDRRFTVISYSSSVNPWSAILLPASKKNRASASRFVSDLQATGITVTDEALHMALTDPTVDTIYLITDGAPTHIGSQGDQLPVDSRQLMKQILEETRARNYLRGVRIFTLGFIDAEEEFLEQLARENLGKYVRIR